MLKQTTLEDLLSVTSSQESAAGVTPSGLPVGPTTDQSGQEAHPASHSQMQESKQRPPAAIRSTDWFGVFMCLIATLLEVHSL